LYPKIQLSQDSYTLGSCREFQDFQTAMAWMLTIQERFLQPMWEL